MANGENAPATEFNIKGSILVNPEFDEEKYWLNRGKNYFDTFKKHNILKRMRYGQQEKELIEILRTAVFADNGVGTILEIGCGFGRITKLLLNNFKVQKIEAFDLSPDQIQKAKEHVTKGHVDFKVFNVFDYAFSPNSFDLIVATEVLMHIPPEKIDFIIEKMYSSSRRYVVSLDNNWCSGKLGSHCFNHSYVDLYKQIAREGDTIRRFALRDTFIAKLLKSVSINQSLYIVERQSAGRR